MTVSEDKKDEEFVRLIGQYQGPIFGYILALVPRWQDAQDLLQETSLRLWRQREEWDPDRDFLPWACTVARYMVGAHRKKNQREKLVFGDEAFAAVAGEVEAAESEVRMQALRNCVARLGGSSRELLVMVYDAQLSIAQVAEQWGRSREATDKAISRIRRSLRECVVRSMRLQEQQ